MALKTFLWIEDRKEKAGYLFWSILLNGRFKAEQ